MSGTGAFAVRSETTPMARAAGSKLAAVQAARGVAAVMVAAFHGAGLLALPKNLGHDPLWHALGFGHAGVDFFFVLSGFIIMNTHLADIGRPERLRRYLWRRFTRIYPIYWLVTAALCVNIAVSPDLAAGVTPSLVLKSLLLLPDKEQPLLSVAWTLRSEMLFYLAFALAIADRRFCKPLVFCALLLVLAGLVFTPPNAWVDLLVSPFNLEFLMGVATAGFLARRQAPKPVALALFGSVAFLAVGALEVLGIVPYSGLFGRALYGSASVAILLGLVTAERAGAIRLGSIGVMAGDSSYGLYLIHFMVMGLLLRVCSLFGLLPAVPGAVLLGIMVGAAVLAAVALHICVEAPVMKFIRGRTPRAWR
jgi:peptidoglycan/LPS O-acetylase OafA/YrhL